MGENKANVVARDFDAELARLVAPRAAGESTANGDLKTFAVRIKPTLSVDFHRAAGPGRASKVMILLMERFVAENAR